MAILTKTQPNFVEYGCGIENIDFEGRFIRADFDNYSVMSIYFPSGSSGDIRPPLLKYQIPLDLLKRMLHKFHGLENETISDSQIIESDGADAIDGMKK